MDEVLMNSFISTAKSCVVTWMKDKEKPVNRDAINIDVIKWRDGQGFAALSCDTKFGKNYTFYVIYQKGKYRLNVYSLKEQKYVAINWKKPTNDFVFDARFTGFTGNGSGLLELNFLVEDGFDADTAHKLMKLAGNCTLAIFENHKS